MATTAYTKAQVDILRAADAAAILLKYVPFQSTAPDSSKAPVWVDTSTTPQVLRGWNGSAWVALGGTGGSGAVTSVAGRTGVVTLNKSDVGLANVSNTADSDKPISTAESAALALKAPLASPALTGTPTAPTQSAGDNDTSIATTAFVQTAIASVSGGGGTGGADAATPYGVVWLDSFAGGSDDARLTNALTQVAADTYPRTIMLSAKSYAFSTQRTAFDGLRIQGPAGYGNPERGTSKTPSQIVLSTGAPWLLNPTGASVYGVSLHNLSFKGGSTSTVVGQSGGGTWYCLSMRDIFSSGLLSVLGTQSTKLLLTAANFTGDWEINNSYSSAFHIGGSDNTMWTDGMLLDSATAFNTAGNANGQYHLWMDGMDKSYVGPVYITCEGGWGGIQVTGPAFGSSSNNQGGPIAIVGAKVEGRNPGQPCNGANVRIDGGIVIMRDSWVSYGMANTSSFGNGDVGLIHHTGGQLLVSGGTYDRASGVAETVPWVYTSSNADCIVANTFRASRGGAWSGRPRFAKPTANAENRTNDGTTTLTTV